VLVIDGAFAPDAEGAVQFYEALRLSDADVAAAEAAVRRRVLPCFERCGWLEPDTAQPMRHWNHRGGFSVDASVRLEAWDRAGLERLLRYAARPWFALNRLSWADGKVPSLLYTPPDPCRTGAPRCTSRPWSSSSDSPRSSPPPRQHRHRYHGVLAPHSPWREQVTARSSDPTSSSPQDLQPSSHHWPGADLWAMLLARIYEVFPLHCPQCGVELRIIGFVTETLSVSRSLRFAVLLRWAARGTPSVVCPLDGARVHRTLASFRLTLEYVGEPIDPPCLTPARGPPTSPAEGDQTPPFDPTEPEPAPDFEIDPRVRW
jgi:hypothetical protein